MKLGQTNHLMIEYVILLENQLDCNEIGKVMPFSISRSGLSDSFYPVFMIGKTGKEKLKKSGHSR